ncbi:hypothetical protein F4778DRAFT_14888 [Xylariomycetidae sp. FL2044]|nr:hypothetical protein F4778DRAFT_14888 [Xylariomycetidae sp. FL2044]
MTDNRFSSIRQRLANVSSTESLADRICLSLVECRFGPVNTNFLPEDRIDKLVTECAIRDELALHTTLPNMSTDEDKSMTELIQWTVKHAKKVFTILVHCRVQGEELLQSVLGLHRRFTDHQLPIIWTNHDILPPEFEEIPGKIELVAMFCDLQWKFLAPVFTPKRYEYNLSGKCIFPFIESDPKPKEGAFGCVYKVKIHSSHVKHDIDEFALKQIHVSHDFPNEQGTHHVWEVELRALGMMNALSHNHITRCIAAIQKGDERYFVFPWADGGSLRDYWKAVPDQVPEASKIRHAIMQLRGLADALYHMHNYSGRTLSQQFGSQSAHKPNLVVADLMVTETDDDGNQSIRHGDLKPENILVFRNTTKGQMSPTDLDIFKMADMGLAKRHVVHTQLRSDKTSTRYGTRQYEAPEAVIRSNEARSRLYDIWSMGCIALEYVIWLLYGNDEVDALYEEIKQSSQSSQQVCQYYEVENNMAKVHRVVRDCMDQMQEKDPECKEGCAIGDLLKIIRTRLLVVPLSPHRSSAIGGSFRPSPAFAQPNWGDERTRYRATAENFRDSLDDIIKKLEGDRYILTGQDRTNVTPPHLASSMYRRTSNTGQKGDGKLPRIVVEGALTAAANNRGRTTRPDYSLLPMNNWEFPVDNKFAGKVVDQLGVEAFNPQVSRAATLCQQCTDLDFWRAGFAIERGVDKLFRNSKTCALCGMLWRAYDRARVNGSTVRFERNASILRITGGKMLPALTVMRSPELSTPSEIQIGFPEQLKPGSQNFFTLMKLWLQDCDENHPGCRVTKKFVLPTRLIDVGTARTGGIRLIETREESLTTQRYAALSHPWGDRKLHPPFSTLRNDETGAGHTLSAFKKQILFEQLPTTFKDAVTTTRSLGIRYLWIDSICIIQGPDGDFSEEAEHMEDVFSCAYCVLAASRAKGQHDGFLKQPSRRTFITIQRDNEKPFYVCDPIDDFSGHVLEGSLHRRGWVFQEHALARRTIFFTEAQPYFECGKGVRCGSLVQMHHNLADLWGDPNFPTKAMEAKRGMRIVYFQELYTKYSRLDFTNIEDRPFAIAGLENRLRAAYKTQGGFGIFDDGPGKGLFHRSLLWQRGEDEPSGLTPITFSVGRSISVPSWSWMAYSGGIDYLELPFETTEWEKDEIHPPWTRDSRNPSQRAETLPRYPGMELEAVARDFNVAGRREGEASIRYDLERRWSDGDRTQCVVVARAKDGGSLDQRRHYVMIVSSKRPLAAEGDRIYKRVGSGYMLGKHITLKGSGTPIRIR